MGGGLKRMLKLVDDELITAYDDRILGSGEFVEQLKQKKEVSERLDLQMPLAQLVSFVAEVADVEPEAFRQRRREAIISEAKSIICYLAVRRIGYSGETVAKALGITPVQAFAGEHPEAPHC